MKVLKIGKISLDGTKVKANASKHSALSHGHAEKLENQLKEEVEELMKLAEEADANAVPDGMDIPDEIARRKDKLQMIAKAKAEIERRAIERETGKKPRGKVPKEPEPGPRKRDQVNLTDE